jgi:surfeit locus 1 family protein
MRLFRRFSFRPLPGLTVACVLLFGLLIALGVWQLQRLQWKLALIASVERNLTAPPLTLAQALSMGTDGAQYHRVALDGRFENDKESYVFATDASGAPAYHVIVPFVTTRGTLLVDRGIVPPWLRARAARRAGEIGGNARIVGVWRVPDPPGLFTPAPDLANRTWYARDLAGIARADRATLAAPAVVEADSTANPGGWPKGGQTQVQFRNEHLQYAITWFALAAGLVAIYFAYHRSRGRLTIG